MLHIAAERGFVEMAAFILQHDIELMNHQDKQGALHLNNS
jgi:hypothetical protein